MDNPTRSRLSLPLISVVNIPRDYSKVIRSISYVHVSSKNSTGCPSVVLRNKSRMNIEEVTRPREKHTKKVPPTVGQSMRKSSSSDNKSGEKKLLMKPTGRLLWGLWNISNTPTRITEWRNLFHKDNYWILERMALGGIILYMLFYINHILSVVESMRKDLELMEKDKLSRGWAVTNLLNKIGSLEIFLFAIMAILTRLCIRGLDIVHWKLELWHKLRENELESSLTLKLKELKLRSKNQIWKTLTEGLTKIFSTIVSAVVPTSAVEQLLLKILEMAETHQKKKSSKRKVKNNQFGSLDELDRLEIRARSSRRRDPIVSKSSWNSNSHISNEKLGKNGNSRGFGATGGYATSTLLSHAAKSQQLHAGIIGSVGSKVGSGGGDRLHSTRLAVDNLE